MTAGSGAGWLAVASAEHVERAVDLGVAQTNHGRRAGLDRMRPGEVLVYWSPTRRRGDTVALRQFTAVGTVGDDEVWQADEGAFRPFRRRVRYLSSRSLPLADVRDRLALTAQPGWGQQFRRGLVRLDEHDVAVLVDAMTG